MSVRWLGVEGWGCLEISISQALNPSSPQALFSQCLFHIKYDLCYNYFKKAEYGL